MLKRISTFLWLGILAGWLSRQQQALMEYLRTENELLKRQLNDRRPRGTDGERRRLTLNGKAIGQAALANVAWIGTPETILTWHRRRVALKRPIPNPTVLETR